MKWIKNEITNEFFYEKLDSHANLLGFSNGVIDLNQINPLHQLWLPLMLAAGAYLMTQSIMAVAIACGTLAFTHINSTSPFWVESIAYPSIVFVCLTVIAMTLIQRFRKRIKATHDERWARRQERQQD
mgnify:CR=1 FL=1